MTHEESAVFVPKGEPIMLCLFQAAEHYLIYQSLARGLRSRKKRHPGKSLVKSDGVLFSAKSTSPTDNACQTTLVHKAIDSAEQMAKQEQRFKSIQRKIDTRPGPDWLLPLYARRWSLAEAVQMRSKE